MKMQSYINSTGNKGLGPCLSLQENTRRKKQQINFYIHLSITEVQVNYGRNDFGGKKHSK